jgi:hypothetical protein
MICERCGYVIEAGELWETRHGATWCAGCCNCEDVGEAGYEIEEEKDADA